MLMLLPELHTTFGMVHDAMTEYSIMPILTGSSQHNTNDLNDGI